MRGANLLNGTGIPALPVFTPTGDSAPLADLRGFREVPARWEIEWHRFFDGLPTSSVPAQRARLFDTRIAAPLHRLPSSIDHVGRSLAFLNLKRGVALDLPSGEDFASAVAGKLRLDPTSLQIQTGLPHQAPLWFWFLKEAETVRAGQSLSPVGGRVIAEVLVGLAENDKSSFLRVQPEWTPTLGAMAGDFTVPDPLRFVAASCLNRSSIDRSLSRGPRVR